MKKVMLVNSKEHSYSILEKKNNTLVWKVGNFTDAHAKEYREFPLDEYDNILSVLKENGYKVTSNKDIHNKIEYYLTYQETKDKLDSLGVNIFVPNKALNDIISKYSGLPKDAFECWYIRSSKNNIDGELLWHGSADTNWVSIIEQGLKIRPDTAKPKDYGWFGKGIYFSKDFSIAEWYTKRKSLSKNYYVALFKVQLGKCLEYDFNNRKNNIEFSKQLLNSKGYDSVHINLVSGNKKMDREYVIFEPSRANIYALVKIL